MSDKNTEFELTITANNVISTDTNFSMNNLYVGTNFKAIRSYFVSADGKTIERDFTKGERKHSNQTLPRIAFQIYEKDIIALSEEEKAQFPVCRYTLTSQLIRGIFSSVQDYTAQRKTLEYLKYYYGDNKMFVIYSWSLFSTIIFVQECLNRFGKLGDAFKLIYRRKTETETNDKDEELLDLTEDIQDKDSYLQKYADLLFQSKNIIFRGAPGTGKTYLAREIATYIASDGDCRDYEKLSDEQKKQIEFVQFHPNYDYADFVEGIRPKVNDDGSMGFELQDGIFKIFVDRARKNFENSNKTKDVLKKEYSVQKAMEDFFTSIDDNEQKVFETVTGNKFTISNVTDKYIYITIPDNEIVKKLTLSVDELKKMLESDKKIDKVVDVHKFFGKTFATQAYSYSFVLYQKILEKKNHIVEANTEKESVKKYVFIIDEINRGEISKILGELFFAIDPGYRGKAGEVSTQFSNMHASPVEKFYVPNNVYIIGTMNDIDRSVDSFDFAMRRRFRFVELKWDERLNMLSNLSDTAKINEAIKRMQALNEEIANTEGLNENYQIGPAYFMKLKTLSFDILWEDFLCPLLQEYINGMYDEESIMQKFKKAYYANDSKVEV